MLRRNLVVKRGNTQLVRSFEKNHGLSRGDAEVAADLLEGEISRRMDIGQQIAFVSLGPDGKQEIEVLKIRVTGKGKREGGSI